MPPSMIFLYDQLTYIVLVLNKSIAKQNCLCSYGSLRTCEAF